MPEGWNLSDHTVFTSQSYAFFYGDYLIALNTSGARLFKYYGEATEYVVPSQITIEGVDVIPYYVSGDFFDEVAGQVTVLFIPQNITDIGSRIH